MNKTIKIFCTNLHRAVEVEGGTTLWEIYNSLKEEIPFVPICATVNNRTESMNYAIYSPREVAFISRESMIGSRVYTHSLCMILYKAVTRLFPGATLNMDHSIARGVYFTVSGVDDNSLITAALNIRETMKEIVEADMRFMEHTQPTSEVIKIFAEQGLAEKVEVLENLHELYTTYYTLDGLADTYYGPLAYSTGLMDIFNICPYHDGFVMLGISKANPGECEVPIPQEKMYGAFLQHKRFNKIIGVNNVSELNDKVETKYTSLLINVAEAIHTKSIGDIAGEIAKRFNAGGARIVFIAGPSSSGKTTTAKRLSIELTTNFIRPHMISLDDYFVNRDKTPRDADGDYDFESLYALDLELFNNHLNTLLNGGEIDIPVYNFAKGEREYHNRKMRLGDDEILLIEGIHGLNPDLSPLVPAESKFKLYVSALTTLSIDNHKWISTTDNRLIRRLIRDRKYRAVSAVDTLKRWPSVRAGEEKWIFPYQENADATFNSSLVYELGVMKTEAENSLKEVNQDLPQYAEAYRLRKLLGFFHQIDPEDIPSTSLLREFIGGSSFHY